MEASSDTQEETCTAKEAAKLLRVSLRTVRTMTKDGRLPVSRIGTAVRINRADVLALVPPKTPTPSKPKDPA